MDHLTSQKQALGTPWTMVAWTVWVVATVGWLLYGTVDLRSGWHIGNQVRIPTLIFQFGRRLSDLGLPEWTAGALMLSGTMGLIGVFVIGWMILPRASHSASIDDDSESASP